jgi:hypothetical protein
LNELRCSVEDAQQNNIAEKPRRMEVDLATQAGDALEIGAWHAPKLDRVAIRELDGIETDEQPCLAVRHPARIHADEPRAFWK